MYSPINQPISSQCLPASVHWGERHGIRAKARAVKALFQGRSIPRGLSVVVVYGSRVLGLQE